MKKILLIDDEIHRNEDLIEFMKLASGHTVHQLTSASDAIDAIRGDDFNYDLIIMDMMFPLDEWAKSVTTNSGHDVGVHIIKELRKIKPNSVIVVVSARTDLKSFLEKHGLSDIKFFEKPVQPVDLLNKINSQLGAPLIEFDIMG